MKKVKNNLKRTLAIVVSLMMLLGACFTGAISASADTSLTEGLTHVATVEDNSIPFGANDWWDSETNIEGGGVALHWDALSAYSNFFYDEVLGTEATGAFPGAYGFSLHFGGYSRTATQNRGDGIIALTFTHTPGWTRIRTGVPFIMIDTNAGTLSVAHGTSEDGCASAFEIDATVIADDILLYDNIKEVPFTVEFSKYSDTQTQVSVNVNGVWASGLMKTAFISSTQRGPSAGNHYAFLNIGGLENDTNAKVPFEINFYGHKLFDQTYVAPQITAPRMVTGLTHVATAEDNVKADEFTANYWTNAQNIAGGGVQIHWDFFSAYNNYFYDEVLGTEATGAFPGKYGFAMQFGGYKKGTHTENYGDGIITISFMHTPAFKAIKNNVPFIMIDTNEGTLSVAHGTSDEGNPASAYTIDAVVITDDLLKYENIEGVPFGIEFSPYSKTTTQVSVNVNGVYATGLMKTAFITNVSRGPSAGNHYIFTGIGGLECDMGARVPFDINFYGHKIFDETYTAPEVAPKGAAVGLTHVATVADNAKPFGSDYWVKEDNIDYGGVALHWDMYSAWSNYFYDEELGTEATGAFPGTYGFGLQFGGYKKLAETENYGDGIIAISFMHTKAFKNIRNNVPFIMLDTNTGTLSVAHGTSDDGVPAAAYEVDAVIVTSDLLKYENISERPFGIEFSKFSDTQTQVAVNVGGVYATGLMETNYITNGSRGPSAGNHYIYMGIGGLEMDQAAKVPFDLNFYGHKIYDSSYKAPELPAQGLAAGLTHVAKMENNAKPFGGDYWVSGSNLDFGGVALHWDMFSAWSNYFYDQPLGSEATGAFPGTNGFMMQFDGYNKLAETENKGDGIIAISFMHTPGFARITTGVPFIMIDTKNGTLSVAHGTSESGAASEYEVDATVIIDEMLKYENIKDVPFTVEFSKYNDAITQVSVNVNGVYVTGLMKTNYITNGLRGPSAGNHYIYAGIGGLEMDQAAKVPFEINFYGFKLFDETYVAPEVEAPEYEGEFSVGNIIVENVEGGKEVKVEVDSAYVEPFKDITVVFTENGESVDVKEYATVGGKLVFAYTATSEQVTVKLAATYIFGAAYESAEKVVSLARFNGEVGAKYIVFEDLAADANGDGVTDVKDLVRMKKVIAGLTAEGGVDLSGDGQILVGDLTLVAKLIASGKKGIRAYTVTFKDAADDAVLGSVVVPAGFGAEFIDAPAKEGYNFFGWSVTALTDINADTVVYATYVEAK